MATIYRMLTVLLLCLVATVQGFKNYGEFVALPKQEPHEYSQDSAVFDCTPDETEYCDKNDCAQEYQDFLEFIFQTELSAPLDEFTAYGQCLTDCCRRLRLKKDGEVTENQPTKPPSSAIQPVLPNDPSTGCKPKKSSPASLMSRCPREVELCNESDCKESSQKYEALLSTIDILFARKDQIYIEYQECLEKCISRLNMSGSSDDRSGIDLINEVTKRKVK